MKIGINKKVVQSSEQNPYYSDLKEIISKLKENCEVVFYYDEEKTEIKKSCPDGMLDTEDSVRAFYGFYLKDFNLKKEPFSKALALICGLFPVTGIFGISTYYLRDRIQYLYSFTTAMLLSSFITTLINPLYWHCPSASCVTVPGVVYIVIVGFFILPILYVISVFKTVRSIWRDYKGQAEPEGNRIFILSGLVFGVIATWLFLLLW